MSNTNTNERNKGFDLTIQEAKYQYVASFAKGLTMLAEKLGKPVSEAGQHALDECLELTRENWERFLDYCDEGWLYGIIDDLRGFSAIATYTGLNAHLTERSMDNVALLAVKEMYSDFRLWELGRRIFFGQQRFATLARDEFEETNTALLYDEEAVGDTQFGTLLIYSEKFPD